MKNPDERILIYDREFRYLISKRQLNQREVESFVGTVRKDMYAGKII